jgi:hypothetical protein
LTMLLFLEYWGKILVFVSYWFKSTVWKFVSRSDSQCVRIFTHLHCLLCLIHA